MVPFKKAAIVESARSIPYGGIILHTSLSLVKPETEDSKQPKLSRVFGRIFLYQLSSHLGSDHVVLDTKS
jgi:hypothetical protein